MQTSKLLGKRRKTYILNVICNRYYFGEVQEEVLGQCSRQGISAPSKEGLSVYQWSVSEKKKQGGWGSVFKNTRLKFLGFSWKFWKNQRSMQVWFHKTFITTLEIPRPKKATPKLWKTLNKFQTFEGIQYFSADLREKKPSYL